MPVRRSPLEAINALALFGLAAVLAVAYGFQVALHELPCPLCMLQRVALAAVAFGFVLNVRYGTHPAHQGLILLAALYGMATSGRQILLHIVPGSGAYGSAFLGVHFYTWAFVLFGVTVLATALMQLVERPAPAVLMRPAGLSRLAAWCAILLTLANAVTTFIQCGPVECDDNPVRYWLFSLLG